MGFNGTPLGERVWGIVVLHIQPICRRSTDTESVEAEKRSALLGPQSLLQRRRVGGGFPVDTS